MTLQCEFVRRGCTHVLFQREYKRSNRTRATKIVRCFPHCCPIHIPRSYCGCSLHMRVAIDTTDKDVANPLHLDELEVYGRLEPVGESDMVIGSVIPKAFVTTEVSGSTRGDVWVEGEVVPTDRLFGGAITPVTGGFGGGSLEGNPGSAPRRGSRPQQDQVFVLNGKPFFHWEYDYKSGTSKWQRNLKHQFCAYVFEPVKNTGSTQLRIVGVATSTPFTLASYRKGEVDDPSPRGSTASTTSYGSTADALPSEKTDSIMNDPSNYLPRRRPAASLVAQPDPIVEEVDDIVEEDEETKSSSGSQHPDVTRRQTSIMPQERSIVQWTGLVRDPGHRESSRKRQRVRTVLSPPWSADVRSRFSGSDVTLVPDETQPFEPSRAIVPAAPRFTFDPRPTPTLLMSIPVSEQNMHEKIRLTTNLAILLLLLRSVDLSTRMASAARLVRGFVATFFDSSNTMHEDHVLPQQQILALLHVWFGRSSATPAATEAAKTERPLTAIVGDNASIEGRTMRSHVDFAAELLMWLCADDNMARNRTFFDDRATLVLHRRDIQTAFYAWIDMLDVLVSAFCETRSTSLDVVVDDIVAGIYQEHVSSLENDVRRLIRTQSALGLPAFVAQLREVYIAQTVSEVCHGPSTFQQERSDLSGLWLLESVTPEPSASSSGQAFALTALDLFMALTQFCGFEVRANRSRLVIDVRSLSTLFPCLWSRFVLDGIERTARVFLNAISTMVESQEVAYGDYLGRWETVPRHDDVDGEQIRLELFTWRTNDVSTRVKLMVQSTKSSHLKALVEIQYARWQALGDEEATLISARRRHNLIGPWTTWRTCTTVYRRVEQVTEL